MIFASEAAEQKGNQRKTTGTYYTPDSLVQALLDTALDPVLDESEAEADDPAAALLKLTVIDPACGSGHFLLAAARRIATRVARASAPVASPSPADYRHALRDVARACIYGVDRNPMAVELTKVALWIETVEPGKPLGFFDAQIRCGDSLLGVFDLKVLATGHPRRRLQAADRRRQGTLPPLRRAQQGTSGIGPEDIRNCSRTGRRPKCSPSGDHKAEGDGAGRSGERGGEGAGFEACAHRTIGSV